MLKTDCDYYPCHDKMESCDTCKCMFYEFCQQLPENIREKYNIKGYWYKNIVWDCSNCTWIHQEDVAEFVKQNEDSKFPGQVFTEALRKFGG